MNRVKLISRSIDRRGCGILFLLLAGVGCGEREASRPVGALPPTAQPEIVAALRDDLEAPRHPSDGGGEAWLEAVDGESLFAIAGEAGRWTIHYRAGPLGVSEGGMVFLQISPFWGWSTPQTLYPEGAGYTEVSTEAEGLDLAASTLDQQLLGVRIGGRALEEGEEIRFVYGAGPEGARADHFAESASRFWIGVDGDGDGVRALIGNSPSVEVRAGQPAMLILTLPSSARPGERVQATVAVLDRRGNAGVDYEGTVTLEASGLDLSSEIRLKREDLGRTRFEITVLEPGIYRIGATTDDGMTAESNPLVVSEEKPRILWGDLHGHSGLSDGTGTAKDYLTYARDVAALDVVSLTDHDHWGMEALAEHPDVWERIRETTRRLNEPGRFVTLLGYEWTNWIHGHRHVLYFEDQGRVLSSIDPNYETPAQLWDALRGEPVLTFAHHSAGGPIATNWAYPPDPELEPVTEIVSVHGSSEAPDSAVPIYDSLPGNFVRDLLADGTKLGFIGSGDSHDGHPGLAGLVSPSTGLAAILSEELTREGILEALRARRVYATNGPRIHLEVTLDGAPMGSELEALGLRRGSGVLVVEAVAPDPLDRIDLVRKTDVTEVFDCDGERTCGVRWGVGGVKPGEFLYVRVVQIGGGTAWSSPFFFR